MAKEIDNSEDEKLTEKQALARGHKEGLEFRSYWTVDGKVTKMGAEIQYESLEDAQEAAGEDGVIKEYRETIKPDEGSEE